MANLSCPNKNLPEWKALVAKVGTFEAYRDYLETNGEIRDPKYVASKIRAREFERGLGFYKGDIALMEQQDEKQEEFNQELNEKLKNILQKLYPEISLQYTNQPILPGQGEVFNQQSDIDNSVNYMLKSVSILQSDKAKQVFEKGKKSNWSLEKVLTELQIPKEQKQLIYDLGVTDREQIITQLAANYSYTVEINTAKIKDISQFNQQYNEHTRVFEYNGFEYRADDYYAEESGIVYEKAPLNNLNNTVSITEQEFNQAANNAGFNKTQDIPTQYYSNLTVPGGTNYTENEIATPAIRPSIKGHAQFATDKGIGWFRSDEQVIGGEFKTNNNDPLRGWGTVEGETAFAKTEDGTPTKTRRVLEVQSDLFQKGRDKKDLIAITSNISDWQYKAETSGINTEEGKVGYNNGKWYLVNDRTGTKDITIQEVKRLLPGFNKGDELQNEFLQLLNKNNNWVTFFVKSIIQDSAKKGYEKVLFPSGNTASKVEGHTTLEEFKKQKEDRIKELENKKYKIDEESDGTWIVYDTKNQVYDSNLTEAKAEQIANKYEEERDNEINQLKQELERVETEGFGALKPIYNFYENTVTNILKKQGYNPTLITDEYGNTWNEVTINTATDLSPIMLQKDRNRIIGQANIKAMSVLIDAVNQKQDTLPHEYAHHYIAWFRNTPIVQEAIKKWGSEEALVQAIGEQAVKQKGEAYSWWKTFVKWVLSKFENISAMNKRELSEVLTNAFLTRTDLSTLTKKPTEVVKPGVAELFESNPELANAVYEALGFTQAQDYNNKRIVNKLTELLEEADKLLQGVSKNKKVIDPLVSMTSDRNLYSDYIYIRKESEKLFPNDEKQKILINYIDEISNKGENLKNLDLFNSNNEFNIDNELENLTESQNKVLKSRENVINLISSFKQPQITPQQKQQAQQLYSQYLESLNKPNTNPIFKGNQQEQLKKFVELQERLNNKEFLEGAKSAYESTPALQQLGTQEEYNDYIARVSLGIIKNPSSGEYNYTSKVKDIVYHGYQKGVTNIPDNRKNIGKYFSKSKDAAMWFGSTKFIPKNRQNEEEPWLWEESNNDAIIETSIINLTNPAKEANIFEQKDSYPNNDGVITKEGDYDTYIVFKPEQIHILGNKQDIEGFKKFTQKEIVTPEGKRIITRKPGAVKERVEKPIDRYKKAVGLSSNKINGARLSTIKIAERKYNKRNDTDYEVSFQRIGESDTYTYTITGGLKPGNQLSIRFYRYDDTNTTAPENLIPNSTFSNEVLSKLPVEYNQEVNNKELGKRMISTIGKRLAENLGIAYENVTAQEAAELTSKADIQWNGEPAFFIGDTVYFVGENTSEATQLHEFAHPLVRAILVSNPQLFNNLYNKVANSVEGQQVIAEVSKRYPEYAKESDRFKEEVIVRATEKAAVLQRQNYLASNPFIRAIQDILYQFKKLFRQLFGKVKVSSLDVNTSIDELADMLQNEFFDIKQDIISLKDQVAYQRTTDEFRNELNEIIEKDPAGLQSIADQMYKLSSDYLYELEKDENYEALKEILKDQFSSNDLIEIKAGISNYQKVVIRKARQVREDIEFRRNQSAAIVQNIQRVFQIATKINDYMKEVAKEEATPDSVNKMHYYSTMLNDIKEFSDMVATVLDQNDLGTSKLGDYVNAIKGRVDASQKYSSKVYAEGVSNVLYSFIEDTNKALIERKKDRIDFLKSKNARPDLIASEEAGFDELIIDKDKFIATLNGNLGDQGALSAFFESYAGNPDPIIASFGLYIKKHIYDVLYKTRDRIYDLHKDLVPALEKAGYKGTNPEEFFKDLVHLEKTFSVENNEEKINQFDYALLAPVKGSDYYYAKQRFLKQKLKQQAIDSGDYTEYAKFLKDESLYMRKYFNQEHSDEYYDLDKIYDKDYSYTDEFGEKQTINGWEAYAQLESINQELKLIEDDPMEDLDIQQKTRDKEVVLRKRARLFDLRYENGKPKVGKDLAIAEILNEYKQAARPFVEYIPRPDAFQKYLLRYEEMLTARGITGDQFDKLRENFIIANTEIAYEDSYYEDLANASQELDDILSTIPSYKNRDKVKAALGEISSALLGYRDENGQPIATDMSDDRIKRVKDAEILMEELRNEFGGISGLTADEWDEYNSYWRIIQTGKLTSKQQQRFEELAEQKEGGLTALQKKLLAKAYDKFNTIRYKEATDYYIDKFNYFLSKIDTDILQDEFGAREVDKGIIEDILSGYTFDTNKLFALLNQDEEFKTWFEENHYQKSYFDKKKNDEVTFYKRVGVWSVNRPTKDKYYKKTKIKDANGNVVETINRVPSFKFRERKIKDKVEIKDEYGRIIKTINNKTPKIVGETVDNRNRWLPKSIEQGAPQDSPFINNEYYALKNNNPDKFKALEILKKFHLATQEGLDNQSKNYLYIPRYGKELSEKIQTKGALKEKRNKLTEAFTTIKEVFVARPDDYEKGLNYKPENQYMSIASDVFNDEESSIAITGLSNMEYSAVSLDLPKSLMKFGLAAERQKKLTEIWPISNALSQLLSDPKASLTIEKMVNSQYVNRQLAIKPSKKSNSQRAQSAKNIIDKEFKGINLKGFGADQAWLVKGVSNMMKAASFGFFGLDLQSASTNTLGMYFQSIIESVGGKDLNSANLAAGSYWANTTLMRQLTMSIYSKGQNKPLELQMWEVFDPAQGRLQAKMSEELSRTLGRDMMNLSFIYSPRKFGELSNMASMWGGMMMQKKIEQKVGNTTKEISYLEAWETGPDGKLKLKDGIDKSYDVGGNQFRLFQNKVHEKMRKLGSVADYDSPEANRLLVFRMVSFLRRHLIPMIVHRMGFSGKPWNPKESVNYASGDAQMGTYIRTLKELFRAFKYGGENIKYMDKQDAAAFYRAVTEIGMLIACNIALYWIFGYDPDDEDRFKKLRKKSGPLPTPWTDEETMRRYPFNLQGWLANHATYQLIKVRAENESFLPLPGFGLDDYSKLIEFDAGAIFSPTIGNGTKVLTGLWDYSMGNPSAYYKKDVGAYEFQQAEGLKALNYLAKMFGITGKTTDPVMAIKNFTSIQAKTSGSTSGRRRKEEERDSDNSYLIR